jgi:hypothetical protein
VGNLRPRLAARQPPSESAPDANCGYDYQPDPVTAIRAMGVKIGGEMAGKNPEHPNPDGDVEHAVIVLVLFTFNDFFHEWLRVPIAF